MPKRRAPSKRISSRYRKRVGAVVSSATRPVGSGRRRTGFGVRASGAIAKFTKRVGLEEVKTLDVLFSNTYAAVYTPDAVPLQQLNCNTGTACVQALNLAQQGPGTSQRIGHKISMKSLRLHLYFTPLNNQAATQVQVSHVRVMVIYDHNPDGAYTASNQILSNINQSNVIQNGVLTDSLNPNFFERMVVLMDKFITLAPTALGNVVATSETGCTMESSFMIDEYINLKSLETIFGNTSNGMATASTMTIAYIQTGALYIVTLGDTAAAAQPWTIIGSARLRFNDN